MKQSCDCPGAHGISHSTPNFPYRSSFVAPCAAASSKMADNDPRNSNSPTATPAAPTAHFRPREPIAQRASAYPSDAIAVAAAANV